MGMMYGGHRHDHIDIEIAWDNAKAKGVFPKRMPAGGYGWHWNGTDGKGNDIFQNDYNSSRIRLVPMF